MTHKIDNRNYETYRKREVGVLTRSGADHIIKFGCIFLLL